MKKVLFLCTGNSARSIMAESVARKLGIGVIEARSAGTRPAGVNPLTIRVLEDAGFETTGLRSKSVEEIPGSGFDVIVTLCDQARQECPYLSGIAERHHWDVPDPAAASGDEESRLQAFRDVLAELQRRVSELVGLVTGGGTGEGAQAGLQTCLHEEALHGGIASLSPREVLAAVERSGAVILDIRPGHETSFRQFDVPGPVIVPAGDIAEALDSLPRDRLIVVADSVGLRSRAAAARLLEAGFSSVGVMVGGMVEWERDGLPVRKDPDFELRGQCGCKLRARGKKPGAGTEAPEESGGGREES